MMRSMLSSFLICSAILFPAAVVADVLDCQVSYSVRLDANFTDDVVVKCTDEEFNAITNVIHAIVELDVISSMLGTSINEFTLAYESFHNGVVIVPTAEEGLQPDPELVAEHLTTEDKVEDMYYSSCGDGTEDCLTQEDIQEVEAEFAVEGADETGGRKLLEKDDVYEKEHVNKVVGGSAEGWTPIELKHVDENIRNLQAINCGLLGGCYASWCCAFCNHCRRRRRLNEPAPTGLTTEAPTAGGTTPPEEPSLKRTDGAPTDVEAALQVKMFEKRVSEEIRKKLRYLARQGAAPCLGNFWELEVYFVRHFFEYV